MMRDLRGDIERIYSAAIRHVHAGNATTRALQRAPDGNVEIEGTNIPIPEPGIYAIAIGKAAREMLGAADHVLANDLVAGIAVTKAGAEEGDGRTRIMLGSHPVPDERSLAAGRAVLEFAATVPAGALVLCLISGGGSALVESPRANVSLEQIQSITRELLRAGASIQELNAVRSRLSCIKGGGLLRALAHTRVVNLIVSDVLGDDVHAIASGPTVPPAEQDAEGVLDKYGLELNLPEFGDACSIQMPPTFIIASINHAINVAAEFAASIGYQVSVLSRSLDGEAREVGRTLGSVAADSCRGQTAFGPGTCLIAGGETVVTVRGAGVGGRNTEAALAAAIRLSGTEGCELAFLASDGDDGVTGSAGAIVNGTIVTTRNRTAAETALVGNDSFTFLEPTGATWSPGPTGTNVNDLVIGIIA